MCYVLQEASCRHLARSQLPARPLQGDFRILDHQLSLACGPHPGTMMRLPSLKALTLLMVCYHQSAFAWSTGA